MVRNQIILIQCGGILYEKIKTGQKGKKYIKYIKQNYMLCEYM